MWCVLKMPREKVVLLQMGGKESGLNCIGCDKAVFSHPPFRNLYRWSRPRRRLVIWDRKWVHKWERARVNAWQLSKNQQQQRGVMVSLLLFADDIVASMLKTCRTASDSGSLQ